MCEGQCVTCYHYDRQEDKDVGMYGPAMCNAAAEIADNASPAVASMFESILFRLSYLHNCPQYLDKKTETARRRFSAFLNDRPNVHISPADPPAGFESQPGSPDSEVA